MSNGMVVDVGGGVKRKSLVISPSMKTIIRSSEAGDEESVSAIQSFINETSSPVKTPSPSVRITSTATGVVNIKAVSDSPTSSPAAQVIRQIPTSTPRPRGRPPKNAGQQLMNLSADSIVGSVRNMKGVSMVTLTAGGIIKKVTPSSSSALAKRKRTAADLDSDDEGDSDDLYDEDDDDEDLDEELGASATPVGASTPSASLESNGKKSKGEDRDYRPPRKLEADSSANDADALNVSDSDANRSKRQRKEKKIFDL